MKRYVELTQGLFNRIMGKREEEPTCSYPGCPILLSDMVEEWGQNVSRTISRGITRYWCREHDPEMRRI